MASYDQEIHEADVVRALDNAGLRWQDKGRYLVCQCPLHNDRNPSTQLFKDDWFASCLAGCGRFHITRAFPELKGGVPIDRSNRPEILSSRTVGRQLKEFDLLETWARLPLIPRSHEFANLPLEVLDDLGWRWEEGKNSYFIPYFNQDKTKVPFAQWRHLSGDRRFTFLAGASPTLYGKWNISPRATLFVVEGTSDCATLQRCGIPWIGAPSAASGTILRNFAKASIPLGIRLVYAGDRDEAGDKLREALDASGAHYRTRQPPDGFKDWKEMYVALGDQAVFDWCKDELFL